MRKFNTLAELDSFFGSVDAILEEERSVERCFICGDIVNDRTFYYDCRCGKYPPEIVDEMIESESEAER